MSLINFLGEAYSPILKLIRSEINKEKLSRLGITKNSVLVKMDMKEAKKNETDLIIFANMFPSGEEESSMGEPVLMTGKKMTKAREKLAKEKIPSVWIGWKKGDGKGTAWKKDTSSTTEPNGNFEILRPKEAKENGKCEGIDCLYKSDFAYKIQNPKKEELLRKFRKETPDRKRWAGKEVGSISSNPEILYRYTVNKLIKMMEKAVDKINNDTMEIIEDELVAKLKEGNVKDFNSDWTSMNIKDDGLDKIIDKLVRLKPKDVNKDDMEKWYKEIREKYKYLV
jgi:hypothetical protein